ncbi:MAG: thiamine pyrophosphate-binding protein [Lachnospiraceae bacterium]|jgi:acetolactate synthase-1/2/3 large subunit|nr:thiamine pyrophosphate-binding protein [Lachnospiraceae bacterium]
MKKRVADIVKDILIEEGIKDCFTLTGGGAMHLNDAFGNSQEMHCTYFLHEQGAAIAAEAYARVNNQLPVVCVTTGPGGTNALTGVLCAWQDSIPMLVISGQVKTSSMVESTGLALRQFGEQESRIVETVSAMTKFAVTVKEAEKIKYYLKKAIHLAKSGRRGPCWIDIPLDVQGKYIELDVLEDYIPEKEEWQFEEDRVMELLRNAKRPVILAGSALRTAEALDVFRSLCNKWNIPVIAAKSLADIMPNGDKNYFGNFGINGGRAGNFIVQNADCLLVLGCRLAFGHIGFNYELFSPNSIKIVVDVDKEELKKETVKIDCAVNVDVKFFLERLVEKEVSFDMDDQWLRYCCELREKFPVYQAKFGDAKGVNAYYFAAVLKKYMDENAICIMGNNCSSMAIKQCGVEKTTQRMWGNVNCGTMGYDIPASIGASIAAQRQVICCAGDGSFQMNIQELQTIVNYALPIKLFVFNNGGYRLIVLSQSRAFGRLSGCTKETGLGLPDIQKIAFAYGIPYFSCGQKEGLEEVIEAVLRQDGYAICEIYEDVDQTIEPKLGNIVQKDGSIVSPPISDLTPLLDRELYRKYSDFKVYTESIDE